MAGKGQDYYFQTEDQEGETLFWIVKKSFWHAEGRFCDQHDSEIQEALPDGFANCMESCYEYYFEGENNGAEGLKAILAAGFEPLPPKASDS